MMLKTAAAGLCLAGLMASAACAQTPSPAPTATPAAAPWVAGPAPVNPTPAQAAVTKDLNPASIDVVLPENLKWEGVPGELRAKLYGDPEKPGPYAIIYKWEPGHHSKPHTHAYDRVGYVISGTWWMSTSSKEDLSTLKPVTAGNYVIHKGNQVHWDGGVDNTAVIIVTGVGPIKTTRLPGF